MDTWEEIVKEAFGVLGWVSCLQDCWAGSTCPWVSLGPAGCSQGPSGGQIQCPNRLDSHAPQGRVGPGRLGQRGHVFNSVLPLGAPDSPARARGPGSADLWQSLYLCPGSSLLSGKGTQVSPLSRSVLFPSAYFPGCPLLPCLFVGFPHAEAVPIPLHLPSPGRRVGSQAAQKRESGGCHGSSPRGCPLAMWLLGLWLCLGLWLSAQRGQLKTRRRVSVAPR